MAVTREYKVAYNDCYGNRSSFKFSTDRSFNEYGGGSSQGILGLGLPFSRDLMSEATRHDDFDDWSQIVLIHCIDTGATKVFNA